MHLAIAIPLESEAVGIIAIRVTLHSYLLFADQLETGSVISFLDLTVRGVTLIFNPLILKIYKRLMRRSKHGLRQRDMPRFNLPALFMTVPGCLNWLRSFKASQVCVVLGCSDIQRLMHLGSISTAERHYTLVFTDF